MLKKNDIIHNLTKKSITSLLIHYSLPAIISIAAMSIYNIIGSIFIGQSIGAMALSAMGVTFPVMNLVFAFSFLVGIGGAAYASIYIGEQNIGAAFRILGNVVLLNLILSIGVLFFMGIFIEPILIYFGASENTLEYAVDYMFIMLLGAPITFSMFNLNHLIRASGHPIKAMSTILLSVVLSVFFTALFILVFNWGMRGAAFAAILSQAGALIWVLMHFFQKNNLLHFRKGIFRLRLHIVKQIFSVGLSPCLVNIFGCLVAIFVNKELGALEGDLGIGAFGIVNRILLLFAMVVVGLSQGMQPIIGVNYGAGHILRAKKTLYYGIFVGTVITTAGFLLTQLCPEMVAYLFTDDERLVLLASNGMRITMAAFPLVGAQIVAQQFFQSIGVAKISIALSVTRQVIFLIPLLMILPSTFGLFGIWGSIAISDTLSFILTITTLIIFMKKSHRLLSHPPME